MSKGRVLSVDYGLKNVGLACCDELRVTVRPLASIPNRGHRDLLSRLLSTVREHRISHIIVGMPVNMDGSSGDAARRVEHFMRLMRTELGMSLTAVDERLSTIEATELWREMSPRQQRRCRTVDSVAAAFILERFLAES
jgi:putative Holliday junction resolvase